MVVFGKKCCMPQSEKNKRKETGEERRLTVDLTGLSTAPVIIVITCKVDTLLEGLPRME